MTTFLRLFLLFFLLLTTTAMAADSSLHWAAKEGDIAKVRALLDQGADVNAKDSSGDTPLHLAAQTGNKMIAELLIAKGADINARDEGRTFFSPLIRAPFVGEDNFIALQEDADTNAKSTGSTALHFAAGNGKKDVVELLIAKGADVNAKDNHGYTPWHWAMTTLGESSIVEILERATISHARKPREFLTQLTDRLRVKPESIMTRRLIFRLVKQMKPSPNIPEEAHKFFVEGSTIISMAKTPEQARLAVQSLQEAIKIAPWWGEAYYNLGVAHDLAKQYDDAAQSFRFYLLSGPTENEAREARDRIYALGAKKKLGQ